MHYPFSLPDLPYSYDSLEPYIDTETVEIHYTKHFNKYVDALNELLAPYPKYHSYSLQRLLSGEVYLHIPIRTAIHNNAGGIYNHDIYFSSMMPSEQEKPIGMLAHAIDTSFGSFEGFKNILKKAALSQFGSGYGWLVVDKSFRLKILTTSNQDTPITAGVYPLLNVDVWEHSYYLKYQYKREEYVDNWLNLINWHEVENRYVDCITKKY